VVVEFLEGDPDRPLVVGTVYNAEYMHPYELPTNKTQSGVKSDSSKNSDGFNQVMFEDKAGSEEINLHAQKDYKLKILDTEVREIGQFFTGQTAGPASRKTTLVQGDDQLTVALGNQMTTVFQNISTTSLTGNISTTAMGNIAETATATIANTAIGMITLTCGASSIMITPAGIVMHAPTITLASDGPLAIKGMPVAIAGSATGMVYP
jgi:type VI secretion system secreted protein VgrG